MANEINTVDLDLNLDAEQMTKDSNATGLDLNLDLDDIDLAGDTYEEDLDSDLGSIYEDIDFNIEDVRVESSTVKKTFDRKFMISYLGLNINTIIKEDLNYLKVLVYTNFNYNKINTLYNDLDMFIPYLEERIMRNSDKLQNKDMMANYLAKLQEFKDFLKGMLLDADIVIMGASRILNEVLALPKETYTVLDKTLISANYYRLLNLAITNSEVTLDGINKFFDIINRALKIEELIPIIIEKAGSMEVLNTVYKNKSYSYTQTEEEDLRLLDFLNIYGDESIFKDVDFNNTNINQIIITRLNRTNKIITTMFNLLLNYKTNCELLNTQQYTRKEKINDIISYL